MSTVATLDLSVRLTPHATPSPFMATAGVTALCDELLQIVERIHATPLATTDGTTVEPHSPSVRFQAVRKDTATAIAHLPKKALTSETGHHIRQTLRTILKSGLQDTPPTVDELQLAQSLAVRHPGGPGLLAAMFLTAAWHWPDAPHFSLVPDELWGDYSTWLFTTPQGFIREGDAERYSQHVLKRLEDLVGWTRRNLGSSTVRAALDAYLATATSIPLYFARHSLRPHAEIRAELLTKAIGAHRDSYDPLPEPRQGRRLRVGFVNRHFGSQTETYTTLPTFEQLDDTRFDVQLFAHHLHGSELENYARDHAQALHPLPADLPGQLSMLREAQLDVIIFGTNVTAVVNEVTRLALYRSAPLQVVNNSSCITSGMAHIDLYVSGDLTESPNAPTHFTERLGLLPGPAHAFNYDADRQEPTTAWTRESLGIPADATVFVTAANYFKIIPEMQSAWAQLLARVPGSYLLVHPFNPNWSSSYPIDRFCREFDGALIAAGVDPNRLRVSTERFPSRSDVKSLLSVGDIYLDTFPFGGVNSLIDPLELGIPPLTWEGETFRSRMGSALLRKLGVEELIATSLETYLNIAERLAVDQAFRQETTSRLSSAMERAPHFLDPLAASDAFGDLLETAFDEISLVGTAAFRADRTPVRSAHATPLDAFSRHQHAVELLAQGRAVRAASYLTAALQHDEANAQLWFDAARAFRSAGQPQTAIQALETCLRIDASHAEAWIVLTELAEAAGSLDLAQEALSCALQLAPSNPKVMQLAARLQSA
ncbi:MAG TPA: tetratricopeptide repeat protein [Opitutaceae bacterium]|nr:tetratricopeptide repeat protein [Opitutaceae bacterium]